MLDTYPPAAIPEASWAEPRLRPVAAPRSWNAGRLVAVALDVAIVVYALALAAFLLVGGIDLGVASVNGASKPILVLLLLVPVRAALGGPSIIAGLVRRSRERLEAIGAFSWARRAMPPAIADVSSALFVGGGITFVVGFFANVLLRDAAGRSFAMPFDAAKLAETFAAWDSAWYFDIARRGYVYAADGQSSIAFFPIYPLLMRAAAEPFGATDRAVWSAGIAVSLIAYALALIALHRLTQRVLGDRDTARRTVLYLAVFPFSLFFTKVYTESTFLLLSVLAVSRAYDGCWWKAGMWGALATLTRPNGMLIALPLALMALRGSTGLRQAVARLAPLGLVPGALALYCAYVYTLSGDPLGWLSAQSHWGYSLGHPPWRQLLAVLDSLEQHGVYDYFFSSNIASYRLFHAAAAIFFLALTPAVFRLLGPALGGYMLVSLLVPLSSNALEGIGRYGAVLFPAFMLLGTVRAHRFHELIVISSAMLLALLVCLFVTLNPIY